ncbi:MAG: hypothetical protein SFW65_04100 [Alphaproteobacteria bacterium]|nr:hypothetical protein [Alphaproteobacteria bacterium]
MRILLLILLLALPLPAFAGMAEAKDLAKTLNCQVKAIVVANKSSGENFETTYKVDCELPQSASAEEKKANGTMLIKCEAAMCSLLKRGE